jgi:hypothetical protein
VTRAILTRPCPVCGEPIPNGAPDRIQVLCHLDWELVPGPLKRTILGLWKNGKQRAGFAEAVASAVEQVRERRYTG